MIVIKCYKDLTLFHIQILLLLFQKCKCFRKILRPTIVFNQTCPVALAVGVTSCMTTTITIV